MPIRGREIAWFFFLLSLVALPTVFGLVQDNELVRTSFQIESLRREKLLLQERHRRLRIERATYESLGRIESEARARGLVPPQEGARVVFAPTSVRIADVGLPVVPELRLPRPPAALAARSDHAH